MVRRTVVPGALLILALAHSAASAPPVSPADAKLDAFLSAVKTDKFQVTPGGMFKPNVLQLTCLGIFPSCNGNNNTNPYLLASLPGPGGTWNPTDPPIVFQTRRDEAIVLIGKTPPPATYFSFRSFILDRFVEREGIRRKIFPALGDPNNMMTIKTAGSAQGNPFDQDFVLVIASDKGTQARVHAALKTAGYPDAIVNDDVISPNMAKMSSTANGDPDPVKDDDFLMLQRFALWDEGYEQEGADYLAHPPITVLRLTPDPRTPKALYAALPVEKLRPRGTGQTELDLLPEVDALKSAIIARYPGMKVDDVKPGTWLEESFVAIQHDLDVLGESRDTVYLRNEGFFTLADDEFIVVYGVNHEKTAKATYANFAVYDSCRSCPYAGENSRTVDGSAFAYFTAPGQAPEHADSLYAWKMARNCAGSPGENCTVIPYGDCSSTPAGIEPNGQVFVGFRAYVEPATKIGPAFTEVVYDRILKFTPSAPEISGVSATAAGAPAPAVSFPAGARVDLRFHVSGTPGTTVSWTATVKADDACGDFAPASGTVSGGGDVTTRLTVPAGQKTNMTIFLDATDSKGRRAKTVGYQLRYN